LLLLLLPDLALLLPLLDGLLLLNLALLYRALLFLLSLTLLKPLLIYLLLPTLLSKSYLLLALLLL
jgi:hypothetical protein